jgi:hypothetical protein
MKKKLMVILLLATALAASAQDFVGSAPEWVNNPPKSVRKFYGVGIGISTTPEMAEEKAKMDAKTAIATQVGTVKVENIKSDKGVTQRKTVNATLSEVKVVKKACMKDGERYTVWVLMEMKGKRK